MTDNGLAALAAALHDLAAREAVGIVVENEITDNGITAHSRACTPADHEAFAAAILGERGVFLPDGLPEGPQCPWMDTGSDERCGQIEGHEPPHIFAWHRCRAAATDATIATLRAALDGLVEAASAPSAMQAHEWALLQSALATAKKAGG
jgi:hypothetical protein